MGCFDIYCNGCGAPFTSYKNWDLPQMEGIDTEWLTDAIIEYYATNTKVKVCYYDGYGRFEDKDGAEYDVAEMQYNREVKIYHTLCENKIPSPAIRRYQEQHFNIFKMIEDGKQAVLNKQQTE